MVSQLGIRSWREISQVRKKFTLGEFTDVNTQNFGCRNVKKDREIKGSDKFITLDISVNFDILDKMRITSSESKVK